MAVAFTAPNASGLHGHSGDGPYVSAYIMF